MAKYFFSRTWWYCLHGLITNLFHVYFKNTYATLMIFAAVFFHLIGSKKYCAKYLMAATRYAYSSTSIALFKRFGLLDKDVLFQQISNGVSLDEASIRSIVIRWPKYMNNKIISKGILIITFTKVFSYYLRNIDINRLSKHFYIVLEPSWSGYFDADILCWVLKTKDDTFVQASELLDRISLNALTTNLIPLSFGASDWVDYRSFHDQDFEKLYDSVYVANTNQIKRVVRYMKAIKNISKYCDPEYRGCLVCASWGGKEEIIRSLPKYFQIERNIELRFSLNKEELNKVLNTSKVNILLSYKEGSNRSLFESMFSNTPVICIAENIGVNKSYINESTGLLISDRFLEDGLLYMKDNWINYRPRIWALANISPEKTTEKLISILEARADINDANVVYYKTNNPEVSYLDHPNIEFTDINKNLLRAFEANSGHNTDNFYNETKLINQCNHVFLHRISSE